MAASLHFSPPAEALTVESARAALCLWLEAHFPITQSWYKTLYEDYGKEIIIGIILIVISAIFAV